MSPSAKKFFERSASREVIPSTSLSDSIVIDESGTVMDVEVGERPVLERARRVPRLLEVAVRESVGVDDDRPALGEIAEVDLERRRVHRDEHVRLVARRQDVVVREVHLEAGNARQRPGRRADLRREVGQGREVVAEDRGLAREASPVSCIPSPESPAKRITTRSSCSTGFVLAMAQV